MTGARERHIERCRYNPTPKAERESRIDKSGMTQTFKKRGDIIIVNAAAKSFKVRRGGWY